MFTSLNNKTPKEGFFCILKLFKHFFCLYRFSVYICLNFKTIIMELKNGMFVICPEGDVAPYLTNGKKYEVFDVEKQKNRIQYAFKIKNDKGKIVSPCIISDYYGCAILYDKHWIISKD